MKFFAVFAAVVAVSCASPSSWSLSQLSEAIQSPYTSPSYLPYLENALDGIMDALYSGHQVESAHIIVPGYDLSAWTLEHLSYAIQSPETDPAIMPVLVQVLNQMMEALVSDQPEAVATVAMVTPPTQLTLWSLSELSDAIQDHKTNPALLPYLETALNHMMDALITGQNMESIVVATPFGLLPVESAPAVPVGPVATAPVSPSGPFSPLVHIIVNVIKPEDATAPAPVMPVEPVDLAPVVVDPVHVVDQAPLPEAVIVATPQLPAAPVAAVPIGVVSPAQPEGPIAVVPIGVVSPA